MKYYPSSKMLRTHAHIPPKKVKDYDNLLDYLHITDILSNNWERLHIHFTTDLQGVEIV